MKPCRCDTFTPASSQVLCAECMVHRVGPCHACITPVWWTDLFQVQGTDGRVRELCKDCVEVADVD